MDSQWWVLALRVGGGLFLAGFTGLMWYKVMVDLKAGATGADNLGFIVRRAEDPISYWTILSITAAIAIWCTILLIWGVMRVSVP